MIWQPALNRPDPRKVIGNNGGIDSDSSQKGEELGRKKIKRLPNSKPAPQGFY